MGEFGGRGFSFLGILGRFWRQDGELSGDFGAENGLAFVVKRPCVLDETPKRLGANSSAFGVKCTCV